MKIFVGNVSKEVTEGELQIAFEKYGEVESVTIMSDLMGIEDEDGKAFVEMPEEKRAKKAVKRMNNKKFKGQRLNVHFARKSTKDRRSPERGGGRRADDSPESKDIAPKIKSDKDIKDYKTENDLFEDLET